MDTTAFDPVAFQAALRSRFLGRFLEYRGSVDTTMRLARRAADEGASHGTLVLAEEQTAGRGREGRSFFSPPGSNLYFTLVLRGSAPSLRALPLAVPLAVCRTVRDLGVEALVKWPNDIWAGGRKLSGMLIDSELAGDSVTAFPGIGINVNTRFDGVPGLSETATSLLAELGRSVAREPLLAAICNELEALLAAEPSDVTLAYRELSLVLGRPVTVVPRGAEPFAAVAEEIAADGALLVRLPAGDLRTVHAADVSLRPLDPSP